MAVSLKTSGSQTATLTTEHSLATITDAGTYELWVDTDALVNGETVALKAKCKLAGSGDTAKIEWQAVFVHDQGTDIHKRSGPIPSPFSIEFTLTQTGGTGRAFPWAIYVY